MADSSFNRAHDSAPLRHFSGWLPLLMSGAATAILVGYLVAGPHQPYLVVENGIARADESPTARLWQLLMVLLLPVLGWFAIRWLPGQPRRAALILAAQALAIVAAAIPVLLLDP